LNDIPDWGNSGPEGLAYIPDSWLAQSGFTDGEGNLYSQSIHGANGFAGIMLIAVQTNGWIYAVDLKNDGTYTYVGRYLSSRLESCELAFYNSIGRLYILHNTGGNWLEITDLTSENAGSDRRFTTLAEIQVPSSSNIEGFALAPALTPVKTVGDHWCFFTDDSNVSGALRWFRELPSTLSKVAGDGQTARTNAQVPIPPAVCAQDAFGNPLPDFAITFEVVSGDGFVTGADAVTGADGVAGVDSWVLGPEPGENTLSAAGAGLSGSPITFTATATQALPVGAIFGYITPVLLILLLRAQRERKKISR